MCIAVRVRHNAAYPSSAACLGGLSRLRFLPSGEGDALGDLESEAGMVRWLRAGAHTLLLDAGARLCTAGMQDPNAGKICCKCQQQSGAKIGAVYNLAALLC